MPIARFHRAFSIGFLFIACLVSAPALAEQRRPERLLSGHGDGVMAVAFLPDGNRIVSGSFDKTIKLWDINTGQTLRTYEGHTGAVRGVDVSRDGRWIASASDDRTVRVWDVESGDMVAQLEGHTVQARCVAFRPDGTLVSGGLDGARLWDVKNEKLLWQMPLIGSAITAMAVSEDGKVCAFSAVSGTTHIWNLVARKKIAEVGASPFRPEAVGLSPNGAVLFAEGLHGTEQARDDEFDRLDLATQMISPMPEGMKHPRQFAISRGGRLAITEGNGLDLWDTRNWSKIATFQATFSGEHTHAVAISPDGKRFVAGSGGQFRDHVWVPQKRNVIAVFQIAPTP